MTKTTIFLALFVGARMRARARAYKGTFSHALQAIKDILQARTRVSYYNHALGDVIKLPTAELRAPEAR